MGGRALVQGHEFVRLGARELPAPAQELVEAFPLRAVGGDVDVEVHDRLLLQDWLRTGPYYCGALGISLADWRSDGSGRPEKGGWVP